MSAIWGIASPSIDLSIRNSFDRMTKVMPFSDKHVFYTSIDNHTAIGHSTIGTFHRSGYPVSCKKTKSIAICGVPIWEGAEEEICHINNMPNDSLLDAELIQFALSRNRLMDLGGVYSFVEWDSESKELLLGTDRLGFRGLYYLHDPMRNILYFATRLRGLIESTSIKNDINWLSVLEFLHFGHSLGNKTFYSNINLLAPGSLLRYSIDGVKICRYWDISNIPINHNMSYQEAIENNAYALKKAIRRRIKRCENVNTIVLLSGGADSRRIANELDNQGVKFDTFTTRGFSPEDSEASIAAEVAKFLGKKNTFVELPFKGFIKKFWAQSNSLTDYECCLHQWLLPLVEKIPEGQIVNYDGIAGDIPLEGVFRASGFADIENFQKVVAAKPIDKAKKIIGKYTDLSFFKDHIKDRLLKESVEDSVLQSLQEYHLSENQLTLFFLMNRTRRAICLAPNRILQIKIENMFPYLDIDVIKNSLSVPFEYRLKHTLRRDIVQFSNPGLGSIPYTQYKKQISGYTKNLKRIYYNEKKNQLRSNIWTYFIKSNKIFNNFAVGPKLLTCLFLTYFGILRVPYEFGLTFQVFYEWLDKNDIKFSD